MSHVLACIDGSPSAAAVCDCAAWASSTLGAPLTFLHVLDQRRYPVSGDLSGTLGLGSREYLLEELAALDEKRAKLALEHGRVLLEAACERARQAGVPQADTRQRHGDLADTLSELEDDFRLLVIGRQGEGSGLFGQHIGSNLESVVRTLHRPILVTTEHFTAPRSVMLAFDGSTTARKGVAMLAASPLFASLPVHLVMVEADTPENRAQLEAAGEGLRCVGFRVELAIRSGEVEPTLHAYQEEKDVDLMVMGAYGHSRIRQFFVGSITTAMIRASRTSLLLLR